MSGKSGIFLLLVSFLFVQNRVFSQQKIRYDKNDLTALTWGPSDNNGFSVTVSLVALFTFGAEDRNGLRWGAGLTFSQKIDHWTFSAGLDTYKLKQQFGFGTAFAGIHFDTGKYGGYYYLTKYFQGDSQISGIVSLHLDEFRIFFEDDILAFPFVGFKIYDRFRTGALEVRYKEFLIGTNVYTNEMDGVTDVTSQNKWGTYKSGQQISSPVYLGYSRNNLIVRLGVNNDFGGWLGQNSWHRGLFRTPDFKTVEQTNFFFQMGVDKPYTLY